METDYMRKHILMTPDTTVDDENNDDNEIIMTTATKFKY